MDGCLLLGNRVGEVGEGFGGRGRDAFGRCVGLASESVFVRNQDCFHRC